MNESLLDVSGGKISWPEGLHQVEVGELVQLHKGLQGLEVELLSVGQRGEKTHETRRRYSPSLLEHAFTVPLSLSCCFSPSHFLLLLTLIFHPWSSSLYCPTSAASPSSHHQLPFLLHYALDIHLLSPLFSPWFSHPKSYFTVSAPHHVPSLPHPL